MADHDFDALAAIHFINLEKNDPAVNGNPELVNELGKIGVGTVLISGAKAYDLGDPISVDAYDAKLTPNGARKHLQKGKSREYPIGPEGVSVIRTRVDLPPGAVEEIIPVLNGSGLRRISDSKWLQSKLLGKYMPATIFLPTGESPSKLPLDQLKSDLVAVKGDASFQSKYLEIVQKSQVPVAVAAIREKFKAYEKSNGSAKKNQSIVVQELAIGLNWEGLRGINESSRERLRHADAIEVRMYCFARSSKNTSKDYSFFGTARTWRDGKEEDGWAFVDQESIPVEVFEIADEVSKKILIEAKVKFGLLALDFINAHISGSEEPRYLIREVNTKPSMVKPKQHQSISLKQRKMLAGLMADAAKSIIHSEASGQ